ncbi:MAG: TetR family transcriptional regulator [Acidobacteriota bacterium]
MTSPTRTQPSSRHRLLETSADLFWTRGYRATTTRQIAAVLGLQQASLYHHVSSKEDLLFEICRASLAELLNAAETSVNGVSDPLERLKHLVRAALSTQLQNQKTHATMAFELRSVSPARQVELVAVFDRYRELSRRVIAEAQSAGALRDDIDPRYFALSLWNIMSWVLLWYRPDGTFTRDALAGHILDLWLNGVTTDRAAAWSLCPVNTEPDVAPGAVHDDDGVDGSTRTADRVLDVAAALFRTKGYDASTAREIASVLGIQKASLYHHTRGKGHLLYQICTDSLVDIRRDAESAIAETTTPLDRMRRLAVAHVTSLLHHQDQHATSLLELRALSGEERETVAALREAHEQVVRGAIDEGRRAGVVRTDLPVGMLALHLFSLTNRSMLWFRREGPLSPERLADLFAAMYLVGIAAKPAA